MKLLLCHNYYSQRGGEDQSFEFERDLLRQRGHQVEEITVPPEAAAQLSKWQVATRSIWNREFTRRLTQHLRAFQPDLVHFTNTFPLVSPAAIRAVSRRGTAVVVSLRNYRLVCPAATLFRAGHDCHECLGKLVAWPAVRHGCYRNRSASAAVAGTNWLHHMLGTWTREVDRFFTLSEAARGHLSQAGIPAERLAVKPNFVPEPTIDPCRTRAGAVFVGRLVAEKGIELLLSSWKHLQSDLQLTIVGDGPLKSDVIQASQSDHRLRYLGELSSRETLAEIARAQVAIVPSIWSEPFGRVVIEAFAVGTPVLGSNRGALPELIQHGKTGALFDPSTQGDLERQLQCLPLTGPDHASMSQRCRHEYQTRYSEDSQYEQLIAIYHQALEHRWSRQNTRSSQLSSPANKHAILTEPVSGHAR